MSNDQIQVTLPAVTAGFARPTNGATAPTPERRPRPTVTLETVQRDEEVQALIAAADANLGAIGYTEHGIRHAGLVAKIARNVLRRLGYDERQQELAAIAGYIHDIGNVVSRHDHEHTGALLARDILLRLGLSYEDTAIVMGAIGNHGDADRLGEAVHPVAAAVILADKSDVHRSRVRIADPAQHDAHDRVNYASQSSFLRVDDARTTITLELTVDTSISPVMSYFEIFLPRMLMCRRAAETLHCAFHITINGVALL
jgi:metal-dependent HD superfamily phosphatase/phosphodiesterase